MRNHMESKQQDRDILAALIAVVYVFVAHWTYLKFVNSRLYLVAVLALSVIYLLAKFRTKLHITSYNLQMLLICGGSFIGLIYSDGFSDGMRFTLQLTLAAVLVIVLQNSPPVMNAIYRAMIVSGIACVIFILLQWLLKSGFTPVLSALLQSDAYKETMILSGYDYMTGLSGYTGISGFICSCIIGVYGVALISSEKKTPLYLLRSSVMMLVALIALIMTQKRGLLVAVICAFLMVLLVSAINQKKGKKTIGLIVFGLLIVLALYWIMMNTESGRLMLDRFMSEDDFSSGRYGIWETLFQDLDGIYLLIGHGTGATAAVYGSIGGAHNIFIQIFYDGGIVMLVLYLAWFISSIIKTITMKTQNAEQDKKRYISLFIQILFLIYGFVGNPLYDFCLLMIYIYYTTWVHAERRKMTNEGCHTNLSQCN